MYITQQLINNVLVSTVQQVSGRREEVVGNQFHAFPVCMLIIQSLPRNVVTPETMERIMT